MMGDDTTVISGKAAIGIAAGALITGVALGLFINRRGRDLNLKFHPRGLWKCVVPAVEIQCHDGDAEK